MTSGFVTGTACRDAGGFFYGRRIKWIAFKKPSRTKQEGRCQSFHTLQVRCSRAHKDGEQKKENLCESDSFFVAAERSAGVVQIVQLDLHRRDCALQIFVLILIPGDLVGIGK